MNLRQLADSVRLATPLARFGKVVRTATNQKVGSSNLSGRATFLLENKKFAEIDKKGHCCILVQNVRELSVFSHFIPPAKPVLARAEHLEPARRVGSRLP